MPTPQPLIQRIVADTLTPLFQGTTFDEILSKKLIDPACGSGGFLVAAFVHLIEAAINALRAADDRTAIYQTAQGWQLAFAQKRALLSCIYGVDRDYSAVEVARFSLLVKLLEDETPESLPGEGGLLPSLDNQIVYGDSLVDERIYAYDANPALVGAPLTWGKDIPAQYDAVIGNPPYLKTEDMKNLEPGEYAFYKRHGHYTTAYKQFDKYYLFLERIARLLLKPDGVCGLVVSRKFAHIESGKKIRELLAGETYLMRLVDFGNAQMFAGRTTYSCLLYFSRPRRADLEKLPLIYERINTPQDWLRQYKPADTAAMHLPRRYVSGDNAWILPGTAEELALLQAMSDDTTPLGDVADVFNGVQTSRNAVYVITDWEDEGADAISFTRQGSVWSIEKAILRPFYDGSVAELRSFYPPPETALIIFPYAVSVTDDGRYTADLIPPQVMHSQYPLAYAWLSHNQETLVQRDISPKPFPADEWYRYGRQQALAVFADRVKIIVGVNSLGDKYVYDETNTLLASGGTAGECAIAPFRDGERKTPYDLYFLHALLNHKAVEFFCRKRGSPFRGGWFARGTAVLKEIPIPNIDLTTDNPRSRLYREIVAANERLHTICRNLETAISASDRSRLERQMRAVKSQMDSQISQLYGIAAIIDQIELPT